jgi:hypothetical protein
MSVSARSACFGLIIAALSGACAVEAAPSSPDAEAGRTINLCAEGEHYVLASTRHDVIAYCVSTEDAPLADRMTEVASCPSVTVADNERILDISWPFSLTNDDAAALVGDGAGGQIRSFPVPDGAACCALGAATPEYAVSGAPAGCPYGPNGPVGLAAGNGLQFVNSMNIWPIDISIRPTGQEGNGITPCPMTTHIRFAPSHPTPIAMSRDFMIYKNVSYAVITAPAGVQGPDPKTYIIELGISGDGIHAENQNSPDRWVIGGNKWGPFLPSWLNPDHVAGMAAVPSPSGNLGQTLLFLDPPVSTPEESACGAGTWDVVSVAAWGVACANMLPEGKVWGGATLAE